MIALLEKPALATESGHWYLADGSPYYTVAKADGKGERPVTIRDARKVNAVPSVTTVTKLIVGPGLQYYFQRQMFEAVLRMEWQHGDDTDALFERCRTASKEHAASRAEAGTALHGAIEQFMRGELVSDKTYLPHIANIVRATAQYGLDISKGDPEKSFAHPLGFGGKCDYHHRGNEPKPLDGSTYADFDPGLVIDFKNKPTIEPDKKYGYDEHIMQLAAYREGLGIPNARCLNIFVGIEDKKVLILEWPEADLSDGWEQFKALLRVWQLRNKYTPTMQQAA